MSENTERVVVYMTPNMARMLGHVAIARGVDKSTYCRAAIGTALAAEQAARNVHCC